MFALSFVFSFCTGLGRPDSLRAAIARVNAQCPVSVSHPGPFAELDTDEGGE